MPPSVEIKGTGAGVLNASLEPYNVSRSQKSHNNIRRMLSVVYFEGFFNRFKGRV